VGAVLLATVTPPLCAAALERAGPTPPGFEPVSVSGRAITVDQRRYIWENTLLPVRLESLDRRLTGPMKLEVRTQSGTIQIADVSVSVDEHKPFMARVVASGKARDGISLTCSTTVEYDGVAFADCTIEAEEGVAITEVRYRVTIDHGRYTNQIVGPSRS
jgi:hypothetical protein